MKANIIRVTITNLIEIKNNPFTWKIFYPIYTDCETIDHSGEGSKFNRTLSMCHALDQKGLIKPFLRCPKYIGLKGADALHTVPLCNEYLDNSLIIYDAFQ
jgi:hypothetical protein